jgi:RNA polymerase sigma factor (sigma-70 family)
MEKIKLTETVTAAQNGDSAALETLYKEYAKPVYFLALKLLANKEDSEDITQDVFIYVFQKIGELKTPEAFPTWINRITAGKCTDFLRKKKLTFNIEDEEMAQTEFFEEKDPLLVPDKSLDNAETVKIITEIIDNLPLPQRLCVYYYYYENLTIAQIAENLATNENTVKNRLALAREKIRKALEELEEKEGIKLYAMPLLIAPILRAASQQFQMPQEIMANIFDGVTSVVDTPIDGITSVIETAADGIATVTETATAGTAATTTTATAGTTSAVSMKTIAGIVAAIVVVAGITTALLFANFGGSDEPYVPVDVIGNEVEDEEEPAPANVDEPEPDEVTPPDDEPYIEDDEPPVLEIINERGNTTGNIVNGGRATIQNDVIFYSNINNNGNIHRFNANGTGLGIVNSDNSEYINVIGDWIYYSNMSDGGKIYKIRTDGTDRTKLTDITAEFINVIGEWIYFVSIDWESENSGIYKVKADGTQLERILENTRTITIETDDRGTTTRTVTEQSRRLNIVGDWIYYVNSVSSGIQTPNLNAGSNHSEIYKIRTDGTEKTLLTSDNLDEMWRITLIAYDDWLYFETNDGLYRMRFDGSELSRISMDNILRFNIHDDWLYYFARDDDFAFSLYKSRLDGTEKTLLGNGGMMSHDINIVADFVYFVDGFDEFLELYRVRTDGTGWRIVN